jgi:staphylococcal nuclease domain-containing protein 1
VGLFSNDKPKVPTFNDISGGRGKKIDPTKAKNIFPFLKDERNLTGTIDIVLNGSRFKVRFNNQPVMVVMVLDGVRALPNEGEFQKISEEALQYSKANALQRDVEVELSKVDLKGVFQGTINVNKKDYALELLEKGLAICMGGRYANKKYEEAEIFAKKNRFGLWASNLNLTSLKG